MNKVLVILTINHLIFISFGLFINSLMDSENAGQAPGYGIVYALIIFPTQFLAELTLLGMLLFQCVSQKRNSKLLYWLAFITSFLWAMKVGV